MDFKVIAFERDEYDAWVEDMVAVKQDSYERPDARNKVMKFSKITAVSDVMRLVEQVQRQDQR